MKKCSSRKKITVGCTICTLILIVILGTYFNSIINMGETSETIQNNQGALAIYLENDSGEFELSNTKKFPKEGYVLDTENTTCKNGGTVTQDPTTKKISASFSSSDSCKLYFKKVEEPPLLVPGSFAEYLINKANAASITNYNSGNKGEMFTFNHEATAQTGALTDYRYIGSSPNNYIEFNNNSEIWRIIGVFPVKNSSGAYEYRVKMMRSSSIGEIAYNSTGKNTYVGGEAQVALKDYWSGSYSTISYTVGLGYYARETIADATWYLGASANDTGPNFYKAERSNTKVENGNQDLSTIQPIGLVYPSDLKYTYALGVYNSCYNSSYCNITALPDQPAPVVNSWMYGILSETWTITPSLYSNAAHSLATEYDDMMFSSAMNAIDVSGNLGLVPVVYLKSDFVLPSWSVNREGTSSSYYEIYDDWGPSDDVN